MSGRDWLIVIGSWALLAGGFWFLIVVGGPTATQGDRGWLIEGGRRLFELVSGWLD
jgi:hypothetical protein